MNNLFEDNGATFSECRKYRYALWRIWDNSLLNAIFIGLNPSTANESTNDATIRRVISFAKLWGCGGVYMLNCFAYISTDPKDLLYVGQDDKNDFEIGKFAGVSNKVIFAWGNFDIVKQRGRDVELSKMFPDALCLLKNKNGSPRHPLYVATNTVPVPFNPTPV